MLEPFRAAFPTRGALAFLLFCGAIASLAFSALVLLRARRNRAPNPASRSPDDETLAPLAVVMLALAGLALTAAVRRFHFQADDFFYAAHSLQNHWFADSFCRLLSMTLLFGIGARLGNHHLFFIVVNLAAFGSAVAGLYLLLRRGGAARSEALVSAGLFATSGAMLQLVGWACGFQHLGSLATILLALQAADAAASAAGPNGRRRATAWLMAAGGLAVLGDFIKYPIMPLLPVAWALWGGLLSRPRKWMILAVLLLAVAGPLVLLSYPGPGGGELARAGFAKLLPNLSSYGDLLVPTFSWLAMAVVPIAVGGVWNRRRGASPLSATDVPAGEHGLALALAAIGVASIVPFLLNERYFAPYYLVGSAAWLAALTGRALAAAARRVRPPPWTTVFAALPLGMLAWTAVVPLLRGDLPPERADIMVTQAMNVLVDSPRVCRIVLATDCDDPDRVADSGRALHDFFEASGSGALLREAQGWPDSVQEAHRLKGNCDQSMTLGYCTD